MSEVQLRDLIIKNGFKNEWFNNDRTIARVDYINNKACFIPFPWIKRVFRKSRKILISKVLPSGKCSVRFSESLKKDKYFLPFLRDGIQENVNLNDIANTFPWTEYLTIEHRDKKGGITNPVDPRFQFELIDSRNDNRIICSVIALTYIDKIFVKLK